MTTHDISRSDCHIANIRGWLTEVQEAVKAAFPNSSKSRYSAVYALLLSWEDDDLNVEAEVDGLQTIFQDFYGFNVSKWRIPSKKAHSELGRVIRNFSEGLGQRDNLLIVYYGGHGYLNEFRQPMWLCNQRPNSPSVKWYAHQTDLEEVEADTLILLDCCHAGGSDGDAAKGTKEVIAACGFESWTPGVGEHSFTKSLIQTLKSLSSGPSFTASSLHHRVLERLKNWNPVYDAEEPVETNEEGRLCDRERRKCPIYISLNNDTKRRSIEIVPSLMSKSSTVHINNNDINQTGFLKEETNVTISLQIERGQVPCPQEIADWIREVPLLVGSVKIEAVMNSHSTLVILSLPVAVWNLLPDDPACCFVGFTTSRNLLLEDSQGIGLHTAAGEVRSVNPSIGHERPSSEIQPNVGSSASSTVKGLYEDSPEARCLASLEKLYGKDGVYSRAFSEASESNHSRVQEAVREEYCDALVEVSRSGYDAIVLELLNMGANSDVGLGQYCKALCIALSEGHGKAVQVLLDQNVDMNAKDTSRALWEASCHGHDGVVQVLLGDKGSDISAEVISKALVEASWRGYDKVVQVLLDDKGSDISAEEISKALLNASRYGSDKVVQVLLEKVPNISVEEISKALVDASYRGYDKVVQVLLDKGSNISAEVISKALMEASWYGYDKVVQVLLDDKGSDISAEEISKALVEASWRGYDKVIQVLLDKGLSINVKALSEALLKASSHNHHKVVQVLLDKESSINAEVLSKALFDASSRGYHKVVQVLLDKGPSINAEALSEALLNASYGYDQVVQVLLDKRPSINAEALSEALLIASFCDNHKVVQLLQKHEACYLPPKAVKKK